MKTARCREVPRGFESHPRRLARHPANREARGTHPRICHTHSSSRTFSLSLLEGCNADPSSGDYIVGEALGLLLFSGTSRGIGKTGGLPGLHEQRRKD